MKHLTVSDLLPGDIILVNGSSIVRTLIQSITHSPFSHAAIYAGNGQIIEADGFRNVGYRPLVDYAEHCLVTRVPNLTDVQRQMVVDYCKEHIGTPYDYLAIWKQFERYEFGVNVSADEHGKYICSTLVVDAYETVPVTLTDVPLASPDDIYRSDVPQVIGRY